MVSNSTPEKAFNYTNSEKVALVVEGKESTLIICLPIVGTILSHWSAAKSVDTVCGIICIENEGEKLCQATTQNTQKNLESKQ